MRRHAPGLSIALLVVSATASRAQPPRAHEPAGAERPPPEDEAEAEVALPNPLVTVPFEPGSTRLSTELRDELEAAARWQIEHPDRLLLVEGHASRSGPARANLRLSQRRAELVRDELVRLGADPLRLVVAAYGEDEAGADDDASRRVVVRGTEDSYADLVRAQRERVGGRAAEQAQPRPQPRAQR